MKTKLLLAAFAAVLVILSACEQTENDPLLTGEGKGMVVVKITDAPFPVDLVEEALVTIDRIELKKDTVNDDDSDNDSVFVVFEKDTTIDLLQLSNGVTAIMSKLEIPVGIYTEVRLHVVEASLKIKEVDEPYNLKIPSGTSSGIKLKIRPALEVKEGEETELLLDFDVSRSFKVIGNDHGKKGIKGFIFKPVVRAACVLKTGRLEGIVTDSEALKLSDAWVTLLSGTDTIASSKTTQGGFYAIIGIPKGDYSVACTKEGYIDQKIDKVTITAGSVLKQNFTLVKE
jgi:hypothetical protein